MLLTDLRDVYILGRRPGSKEGLAEAVQVGREAMVGGD